MSKVQTIVIKVSLEDDETNELTSAVCCIDTKDIKKVRSSDIIDACQRAVAHCIDELEENF